MKSLPKPIKFEWDKGNIDKNWEKHTVDYKEAEEVFFNKPKLLNDKVHSQSEERYVALGETNKTRTLFISYTIRNRKIRVISARDMNRKERGYYEKK